MPDALPTPRPDGNDSEGVLLVDDNPTNLQVLVQTLSGQGYKLLVAKSGEDALTVAKKARPGIILLDIMMPGLDGYEVCRQLKADPDTASAAVIFLSALDDTTNKVRGLELGAVDYVSKPFQTEEIVARVRTHMTVRRLQRDLASRNAALQHANQRMKSALEAAARVQQALLPTTAPETDRASFAWAYRPCDELAGDCLNAFWLDERCVGLYVLDVSGHGVPSALLSVSVARNLVPHGDRTSLVIDADRRVVSPAEVATRLNRLYPMDTRNRQYFTLLYGVLDVARGSFRYVTAGHPGPILVPADGAPRMYAQPAIPIGMMEASTYEESIVEMQPGDRLYLYSDGVSEEANGDEQPFGTERLMKTLDELRSASLGRAVQSIVESVVNWRGASQLSDDLSVLAVEARPVTTSS